MAEHHRVEAVISQPVTVSRATIRQFSQQKPLTIDSLYDKVYAQNTDLALYIRRRAAQLNPDDLTDRAAQSRLALELMALLYTQHLVNDLDAQLSFVWRTIAPKATDASTPIDGLLDVVE